MDIGRNDPCPCGSGRKYKHCCFRTAEAERATRFTPAIELHGRDEDLSQRMIQFAATRFGNDWLQSASNACLGRPTDLDERDAQLVLPWALYHYAPDGATAAELFLEERGQHVDPDGRAWIAAQRAAWLSVWEATEVQPDVGLNMLDLLTGATRFVHDQSGSRTLVVRDAVLGRIVTLGEISIFSGLHSRPLPPAVAAGVVRAVREIVGLGKRSVTPRRLHTAGVDRMLLAAWEEAVEVLDHRPLPRLQNTDGDPLRLVTDLFEFAPEHRADVTSSIANTEGADREDGDDGLTYVTFMRHGNKLHRDWDNTIIGRAVIAQDSLRLETNSLRRAAELRRQVESTCGDRIRHRLREEQDGATLMRAAKEAPRSPRRDREDAPEMLELTRQFKERHYESWVGEAIPALGGKTPREVARSARGRARLDELLKQMENDEARRPEAERYDFTALRRRLRL